LINFLQVEGQQFAENFEYKTTYLRFENAQVSTGFKVLRGNISDDHQLQNTSAIIGTTTRDDTHTTFTPLVPFDKETPYTLVNNEQAYVFKIAKSNSDSPMQITGIYPSVNEVPANILKWYIKFSKPVNPIKIYEHISFLDQDGKVIDRSILHLGAPLLSADGTLLTVWIEPGRQKRMLGPNRHLGSVFDSSKKYTIHIAGTLKDAEGLPIEKSVEHTFTTIESDRIKPSLAQWKIQPIEANTKNPLEIIVNEQLDYGSLLDAFSLDFKGKQLNGNLSYNSKLKTIFFTPLNNWKKGIYNVKIESSLEDLAGNNLLHLFDRPLKENQNEAPQQELKFTIE